MPPPGRKSSRQSTLAFGSGAKNRVSKSTASTRKGQGAEAKQTGRKVPDDTVSNEKRKGERQIKPTAEEAEAPAPPSISSHAGAQTAESPQPAIEASLNSSKLVEHQERLAVRSKTDVDRHAEALGEADIQEYWGKICQSRLSQPGPLLAGRVRSY